MQPSPPFPSTVAAPTLDETVLLLGDLHALAYPAATPYEPSTMSTIDLGFLSQEFPNDVAAIVRLNSFFSNQCSAPDATSAAFSVPGIYRITHPCSQSILVRILTRLVDIGLLKELFRLESEHASAVREFARFEDIPPFIFDEVRGIEIAVDPAAIRLFYKLNG